MKLTDKMVEEFAAIDHKIWAEKKRKQGYHLPSECPFKRKGSKCAKCTPHLADFEQLPEELKELNRIRWANINQILEMKGLKLVKMKGGGNEGSRNTKTKREKTKS